MKKLILALVIFASCTHSQPYNVAPVQDHGDYQVVSQPGGSQVVVVKDHSGAEFFMEMMMFQQLMNMSGGMNNVYGYYNQNRYRPDWNDSQTNYRTKTTTVINNYYGNDRKLDNTKPISDQVKYRQSSGFGKTERTPSTSQPSSGFSGKRTPIQTSTPKPTYTPSNGFTSRPSTSSSSTYKPSSGFGSSSKPSYSGSKGFGKKN